METDYCINRRFCNIDINCIFGINFRNNWQPLTSYKFYWGGIVDFKVLVSNIALNVSTGKCIEIPNKTYK